MRGDGCEAGQLNIVACIVWISGHPADVPE